jgi:hypothetical protein
MRLSLQYRVSRTAKRAHNRVRHVVVGVVLAAVAAVAWRLGYALYLDVMLRQEVAYLAQIPCTTTPSQLAAIEDRAQALAESYGLRAENASVRRESDCVVRVDVDGRRTVDLWVTEVGWPVRFTIETK